MHTLPKRESKYKAWDGLLNKWASPTDIRPTDKRPDVITWKEGGSLTLTSHEDFTWVRFTGLVDKNGKEIWEGDIYIRLGKSKQVVQYDTEDPMQPYGCYYDRPHEEWEVIGNIFQNPELLSK